jgi:hypothetical protein
MTPTFLIGRQLSTTPTFGRGERNKGEARVANNRLILVHRPTGQSVYLAKRMGHGWYVGNAPAAELGDRLNAFFDECQEPFEGQDDFMLVMEDESGAPMCGGLTGFDEDGKPYGFYEPKDFQKSGSE